MVTCPECSAPWSEAIERELKAWPGWRRCLGEVLLVPGVCLGVVLIVIPFGLHTAVGQVLVGTLVPISVVCCIIAPIVSAGENQRVPRIRRPHAGLILLCGFGAVVGLHALAGVMAYALAKAFG